MAIGIMDINKIRALKKIASCVSEEMDMKLRGWRRFQAVKVIRSTYDMNSSWKYLRFGPNFSFFLASGNFLDPGVYSLK